MCEFGIQRFHILYQKDFAGHDCWKGQRGQCLFKITGGGSGKSVVAHACKGLSNGRMTVRLEKGMEKHPTPSAQVLQGVGVDIRMFLL
jgi:hypothetical protein